MFFSNFWVICAFNMSVTRSSKEQEQMLVSRSWFPDLGFQSGLVKLYVKKWQIPHCITNPLKSILVSYDLLLYMIIIKDP